MTIENNKLLFSRAARDKIRSTILWLNCFQDLASLLAKVENKMFPNCTLHPVPQTRGSYFNWEMVNTTARSSPCWETYFHRIGAPATPRLPYTPL
jgi:hypothetical protein